MKCSRIGMLLVLGLGPVLPAESYTFTSLLFPGAGNTVASGINDLGTIVGFPGAAQSSVWQNGTYTLLAVGSVFTSATRINVRGDIVGRYSATGFGNGQGFILQGSVLTPIDFPGAATFGTWPNGINSRVEIVGFYRDDDSRFYGFLRKRDQYTAIDVPFQGASNTQAFGINDCGEIVGSYTGSDGSGHGFSKRDRLSIASISQAPPARAPPELTIGARSLGATRTVAGRTGLSSPTGHSLDSMSRFQASMSLEPPLRASTISAKSSDPIVLANLSLAS